MTDYTTIPYDVLAEMVITQLKEQHYMESTLTLYKRIYRRIKHFMHLNEFQNYNPDIGILFLSKQQVAASTLSSYKCAVRRLNDFYEGKEFRCHHEGNTQKICDDFSELLDDYIAYSINIGNKQGTIRHKQYTCIKFLNFLSENGYTDISSIHTDIIAKALLIFSNMDRYAEVRQFLRYLYEKGWIGTDYHEIVPKVKKQVPIPTVYTIKELKLIEQSINVATDIGKRNIAIVRLATRMGLRSGDIAKLREDEINFSSGCIRFIQEKTNIPLELQMPPEVSDSIYKHLENSKKNHYSDGYVFHSMKAPYGRITTGIIRYIVNECMLRAGIEVGLRKHGPHSFRSSLASHMIEDNCSYETVRRILGHSDPNVIKHYAKTDIEKLRLCAISPPKPSGLFHDYLTGRRGTGSV